MNKGEQSGKNSNKNSRAKYTMITVCIGAGLLVLGIILVLIYAFSTEYMDEFGIIYKENFVLAILGFLSIIFGMITYLIVVVNNLFMIFMSKNNPNWTLQIVTTTVCLSVLVFFVTFFVIIIIGNV